LIAGGVGTYFLVTASSKYSALIHQTVDLPTAQAYRASGPTDATLGAVFVGVGVAGVVAAVAMFVFGAPPSSPQVSIAPLTGGGMVSLSLSGF
jgi:hypothetical protein